LPGEKGVFAGRLGFGFLFPAGYGSLAFQKPVAPVPNDTSAQKEDREAGDKARIAD
jgi:hypothetical protein